MKITKKETRAFGIGLIIGFFIAGIANGVFVTRPELVDPQLTRQGATATASIAEFLVIVFTVSMYYFKSDVDKEKMAGLTGLTIAIAGFNMALTIYSNAIGS